MSTTSLTASLRDRRYVLTAWPWRSVTFLATTAVIVAPLSFGLAVLLLPLLVSARRLVHGNLPSPAILFLLVVSAALLFVGSPLVAVPVAALERRRLRLVDPRPLRAGRRPGDLGGLYRDEATWRAVLYTVLLAVFAPPVFLAAFIALLADALMIASPFGLGTWQFGAYTVDGGPRSIPLALVGLAVAPALLYLAGALAAGHAMLARRLLGGGDPLRDQLGEVSQSRARLADAFDAERRRIERDLHDGAQHRLTSLTLHLGMARLDLPPDSPAAEPLGLAHTQAKELMVVLRDLVHGIRPQVLTDLGLPAALRELAASSPVPVVVEATITTRPPESIETTAYFVAAEALTNIAKHARATAASVRVTGDGTRVDLEIQDNGRGGADPRMGTGLTGLADRVAAAGGRLLLASPAGGPTLMRVELPCPR
ncbi:sensor domain-containing protein [Actinoplanes sp. L3-i22]|uniref:sensor histidine kinase n=1 Tax=Actinoplanes sp. L3-i22 TaxID=2836373 RepID=UPI001C79081E|nr:sensor domain-containing protein [Actinoplanes sp. L3-i22]BCY13793.1 histidine kinase [Actinoplanes sp. L3-i22]